MTKEKVNDEIKIPDPETSADKPPEGISEEEWKDLSPTEKEGIIDSIKSPESDEDEEESPEIDEASLKEIAEEKEEESAPAGEKKVEKPAVEKPAGDKPVVTPPGEKAPEQPPVETTPPAAEKVEEGGETRVSDDELRTFQPQILDSELPTTDTVPAEIQTKLDALDTKYEEGEVSLKEYNNQRDALNRQVMAANFREIENARMAKGWEKAQVHFLANRPEYMGDLGEDGRRIPTTKSSILFGALRETISIKQQDPKFAALSDMDFLIAVDREVKTALGMAMGDKLGSGVKLKVEDRKPPATRPDHHTLTDIPAAAPNTTDGAFAALDKLQGEAYEDALARLTPEQRARYEDDLRPRAR